MSESAGQGSQPSDRSRWRPRWPSTAVAIALLALVALLFRWQAARDRAEFVTEPVIRADIARSVVTTGSVNPVVTVQVGTYVSGPIQSIECDFNSEVEAGQRCAKIDPSSYQQAVDRARAGLSMAEAQLQKDEANLAYAKMKYERDSSLRKTGVVSQDTLDVDQNALDQAIAQISIDQATIAERRAALEAAEVNLNYTNIVSPVNGTVVSRNVDVGQTVAASFQTPTLFVIAQDLTKVQIDTNVSESDVGETKVGQRASFTVEAYPARVFEGVVSQVRRAPITVQNVVTYDVVVSCDNPDRLLFPGMTADVRIFVDERLDVPTVPERALRFDPGSDSDRAGDATANEPEGHRVWVLRDGRPVRVPVEVGLDDGTRAEIVGDALALGTPVIVDVVGDESRRDAGSASNPPFRF